VARLNAAIRGHLSHDFVEVQMADLVELADVSTHPENEPFFAGANWQSVYPLSKTASLV
jgi:hypothetical protein